MKAFHNDQAIKDKYLARVKAHEELDEIIQGQYWGNGKGCAIGCTIHGSDHSKYKTELGIPKWLAYLEDKIFEGLDNERAKSWPREFLESINIGADLDKIKIPFLIFIVESAREKFDHAKQPIQLIAIDDVHRELKKEIINKDTLLKAQANAYAANACAAACAAYAAAYAAAATYTAAAAAANACAAYAAAAYTADAKGKEFEKFADKLLELLRNCP